MRAAVYADAAAFSLLIFCRCCRRYALLTLRAFSALTLRALFSLLAMLLSIHAMLYVIAGAAIRCLYATRHMILLPEYALLPHAIIFIRHFR